jgi:hypothetical protein
MMAKAPFNIEEELGKAYNTNERYETLKEFW